MVGLLFLALVFFLVDLDLALTSRFYDAESSSWPYRWQQPWRFLNGYGEFPGLLFGISALVLLLLSIGRPALHAYRKVCTFLLIALLVGPGLLVNSVLKQNWGRPRPNSSTPFDGPQTYEPFLYFDPSTPGNSFPSGHASMGFYLLAVGLLLLAAGHRLYGKAVIWGSLALGFLIGFSRVCSGKHFPSDVVGSALVVWATTLAVFFAMGLHKSLQFAPGTPRPETVPVKLARALMPVLVILITAVGAAKLTASRQDEVPASLPVPDPAKVEIHLDRAADEAPVAQENDKVPIRPTALASSGGTS